MKTKSLFYSALIISVVSTALFFSIFVVDETKQVIVKAFGEIKRVETTAGIKFKFFWENVVEIEKRQMLFDAKPSEIITKDKKKIVVDNYTIWRIVSADKFAENLYSIENAKITMNEIIFSSFRSEIGQYTLSDIISDKKEMLTSVIDKTKEKFAKLGIEIIDFRIIKTDLPKENVSSVVKRMQSEREAKASKYRAEGEETAKKIIASTDRVRDSILAVSSLLSEKIKASADSSAFEIYKRGYTTDKEFFDFYLTVQMYKSTLDSSKTVVLPYSSTIFKYLQ